MPGLVPHPHSVGEGVILFFALLIGHALADYPLQGDFLALHKDRHYRNPARDLPAGLWVHCLFAHSLIHAGMVWLITGRVFFAFAELVIHGLLDFVKSENRISFNLDQFLHAATKALFVAALVLGWVV